MKGVIFIDVHPVWFVASSLSPPNIRPPRSQRRHLLNCQHPTHLIQILIRLCPFSLTVSRRPLFEAVHSRNREPVRIEPALYCGNYLKVPKFRDRNWNLALCGLSWNFPLRFRCFLLTMRGMLKRFVMVGSCSIFSPGAVVDRYPSPVLVRDLSRLHSE